MVFKVKFLLGALFFLVLFFSGCVDDERLSVSDLEELESLDLRIKEAYQPVRAYGDGEYMGRSFPVIEMFSRLPELPDDFYKVKYRLMTGSATAGDLCDLEEEYFVQPEFISNTWVEVGLPRYKKPSTTHWTPEGYGTFPHEIMVLTSPGDSFEVCTFLHSSFGVETYQGLGLRVVYPDTVNFGGLPRAVSVSDSKSFLSGSLNPDELLLEPSYVFFERGWIRKVRLNVSVSPSAESGVYSVGFDVGMPSLGSSDLWRREYEEEYQGLSGISVSEPQFVLGVEVR